MPIHKLQCELLAHLIIVNQFVVLVIKHRVQLLGKELVDLALELGCLLFLQFESSRILYIIVLYDVLLEPVDGNWWSLRYKWLALWRQQAESLLLFHVHVVRSRPFHSVVRSLIDIFVCLGESCLSTGATLRHRRFHFLPDWRSHGFIGVALLVSGFGHFLQEGRDHRILHDTLISILFLRGEGTAEDLVELLVVRQVLR